MPDTTDRRGDWRRLLPDSPSKYFRPGMDVRHLNPDLADWRGVVEPATTGRDKGRCVRKSRGGGSGEYIVRVRWTAGVTDGHLPETGWYGVEAVEIVVAVTLTKDARLVDHVRPLPGAVAGRGADAMKPEEIAAALTAPVTGFGIARAAEAAEGGRS